MKQLIFTVLLLAAPAAAQQGASPFTWDSGSLLADIYPEKLTIMGRVNGQFEHLVDVDMRDGRVTFGPHFTQDEASRVFWQSLASDMPHCDWGRR